MEVADAFRFGAGVLAVVLAALMIADSVLGTVGATPSIFGDVSRPFEFVVGLVALMVGTSFLQQAQDWARAQLLRSLPRKSP